MGSQERNREDPFQLGQRVEMKTFRFRSCGRPYSHQRLDPTVWDLDDDVQGPLRGSTVITRYRLPFQEFETWQVQTVFRLPMQNMSMHERRADLDQHDEAEEEVTEKSKQAQSVPSIVAHPAAALAKKAFAGESFASSLLVSSKRSDRSYRIFKPPIVFPKWALLPISIAVGYHSPTLAFDCAWSDRRRTAVDCHSISRIPAVFPP